MRIYLEFPLEARYLGLSLYSEVAVQAAPSFSVSPFSPSLARLALLHTWVQCEGWIWTIYRCTRVLPRSPAASVSCSLSSLLTLLVVDSPLSFGSTLT